MNHSLDEISKKIEAVLFWKGEPVNIDRLSSLLKISKEEIRSGLKKLEYDLRQRGISLVQTDEEVMLGTARELAPLIEEMAKDELAHDLGKAGLETLSIVLYQGPISRADIDYIRGVNSQFILRNLLIRGLVERIDNPSDSRSFLYKPTLALIAHLGISKIQDLPEYDQVKKEIENHRNHEK